MVEARATTQSEQYEPPQADNRALILVLVGMMVLLLFAVLYTATRRRQSQNEALMAMHASMADSEMAHELEDGHVKNTAHDQL